MATMYPPTIDPTTVSQAERRLYQALESQLEEEWLVFHQVRWIGRDERGRARDGETDFVVAHPQVGILVIEVKGGQIGFDRSTNHFTSTNQAGTYDIGDPFQQATTSKHTLLDKMRALKGWPARRILFGHAVAFPDSVAAEEWLRPNAPRTIILDYTDLPDLRARLLTIFTFYARAAPDNDSPGSHALSLLTESLAGSGTIRHPLLAEQARLDDRALLDLTQAQFRYLRFLNQQRRAIIQGCAGSGKSVLAVEKARRLAEEGLRVLYTCYNRPLADHIGVTLGYRQSFDVFSFHQLCIHWSRQAGKPVVEREDKTFFATVLPNALLEAVDQLGSQYDAIIVDEGQDFRAEWWAALPWLLHHPDSDLFYIFADDNQRLYADRSPLPFSEPTYTLYENCRNTHHVFKVVTQFYTGPQLDLLGPQGRPVVVLRYANAAEGERLLRQQLHHLTSEAGFQPHEIAVLSALSRQHSEVLGKQAGRFHLSDERAGTPGAIFATTVRRFKGLDRSVILLCEVDGRMSESELETLMYVGTSRAKTHLILLMGQDAPTTLQAALAPFLQPER